MKNDLEPWKSIFFCSVEKEAGKEQEENIYLLLQTAKQLSSAEVLMLSANYQIVKNIGKQLLNGVNQNDCSVNYWAKIISEKLNGNILPDIVLQRENHLIELHLISDRHYPVNTTSVVEDFKPTKYFRMTDLGCRLCEVMMKYE